MYDYAFIEQSCDKKAVVPVLGSIADPTPARLSDSDVQAALLEGLPCIDSALLEPLNLIFRTERRFSFEWPDGGVCTVVLLPDVRPAVTDNQSPRQVVCDQRQGRAVQEIYRRSGDQRFEWVIEARLGPHHVSLCVESTAFAELLDGENAALLPPDIKCALLESYFDDAVRMLEQAGGQLVSIDAMLYRPEELPARGFNLFFVMQRGGLSVTSGYLSVDLQGLKNLAGILKHQDHPLAWERLDDLRIPVSYVLGSTRLPLSEINRLTGDDIVLLDGFAESHSSLPIRIDVAGSPFWMAKQDDPYLVVEAGLEHAMEKSDEHADRGNEEIADLEDIELELIFELGRKCMPLAEVRRIGPGYIFDLAGDFLKPVSIRINGRRIGCGELVKIDNRLGVRLTQYFQRQESSEC